MKAVVLETRGRKAAVLAKDGTVRIARGRYNVGDTVDLERSAPGALRRCAAAAAAVALLCGGAWLWVDRNYVACAEVSLDAEPSIIYTLNKRDRVLGVRAANAQGQAVVDALEQEDIRFATLSDAVDRTVTLLEDEGYLSADQDDYVLLNVSADDDARRARLIDEVEAAMTRAQTQDATLEYRIDHSDRQTAREADANGMSPGRYAIWQRSGEAAGEGDDRQAFAEAPVRTFIDPAREAAPEADEKHPQGSPGEGDPSSPSAAPDAPKPQAEANLEKPAAAEPKASQPDEIPQKGGSVQAADDETDFPDEADNPVGPGEARLRQSPSEDSDRAEPDAPDPAADADDPGAAQPEQDAPRRDADGSASGKRPASGDGGKRQPERQRKASGDGGRPGKASGGRGGPGRG